MTYRQLETSKELRLWVTQVIAPIAITIVTILSIPEAKDFSEETLKKVKKAMKKFIAK